MIVAELYRSLGAAVEREPGDGPTAGRGDCLLPDSAHDTGSRSKSVRMSGERWSCESCRNFGDVEDLLAFLGEQETTGEAA